MARFSTSAASGHKPDARRKPSIAIRRCLADQVRRRRERLGYTQGQLAKACHLNEKYIARIEQALLNVTLSSLEAIAKGLRCTEAALLTPRREAKADRRRGGHRATHSHHD
jgi:transcriptional regulator with XRE-family HTH domain